MSTLRHGYVWTGRRSDADLTAFCQQRPRLLAREEAHSCRAEKSAEINSYPIFERHLTIKIGRFTVFKLGEFQHRAAPHQEHATGTDFASSRSKHGGVGDRMGEKRALFCADEVSLQRYL